MTPDDLDRIDTLAQQATPLFDWWKAENFTGLIELDDRHRLFIAACDPATVRGLVARIRELEGERDQAQQHVAYHLNDYRLNSEPTADLAVEMAGYATRLRARAEAAEARCRDLEAELSRLEAQNG